MRRISGELGVAVGTIYNYFESREELLVELFTISWKRTIEHVEGVIDASKEQWVQLKTFFEVIAEDVKSRNGLGKEIYIFNSYKEQRDEHVLNIRVELLHVVERILNQKSGSEEANEILARWIMTVFVDALVNDRIMTHNEMQMLSQVIATDYTLA